MGVEAASKAAAAVWRRRQRWRRAAAAETFRSRAAEAEVAQRTREHRERGLALQHLGELLDHLLPQIRQRARRDALLDQLAHHDVGTPQPRVGLHGLERLARVGRAARVGGARLLRAASARTAASLAAHSQQASLCGGGCAVSLLSATRRGAHCVATAVTCGA